MFLQNFNPSPVLIQLGPLSIHWYGFFIFSSLLLGFLIGQQLFKLYRLDKNLVFDLGFYLILFSLLGARFWHVLSALPYYLYQPLEIFKIWHGGLAIHGVLIAGLLTIIVYARIKKLSPWLLLDIFAPLLALGQSIGRWGNYFNSELYGAPTAVAWAIPITFSQRLPGYQSFEFFHPLFLYESLACFLIFLLLIFFHSRRIKNLQATAASYSLRTVSQPGLIFVFYLLFYSLTRFLVGFLRIDPQYIWFNLRFDQWVSLILLVAALAIFIILTKNIKIKRLNPPPKGSSISHTGYNN